MILLFLLCAYQNMFTNSCGIFVPDPTPVTFYSQQRVFSVQVFELHILIKDPHISYLRKRFHLAKPPLKGSPCKNLPSECVVTPPVHVAKHKDNSENPNHKMECSAENAVEKTPFASVNNGQPPNFRPHAGPTTVPMAADNQNGSLVFPSFSWTSMLMRFQHLIIHQGIEVSPGAPPVGNACFPPYGMPGMNPAISGSAGSGSCGQTAQFPGGHFELEHATSKLM
ncbi:elf3a [Populus alba x Populus x berolinensis]|nr:elf3a [Populus alba x Populus x berolinensis]